MDATSANALAEKLNDRGEAGYAELRDVHSIITQTNPETYGIRFIVKERITDEMYDAIMSIRQLNALRINIEVAGAGAEVTLW